MEKITLSKMKLHLFMALGLVSLLGLGSCQKPEILLYQQNEEVRSVGDFLNNNFNYTLFSAALEYTGLLDTLRGVGPFTVFAPDDNAFNRIGIQRPSDFAQMDRDSLRYVLAYHIVPNARLMMADFPDDEIDRRYETLAQSSLYASKAVLSNASGRGYFISASANIHFYVSGATVKDSDFVLSNGVVHTLTKMMKPFPGVTVRDWLASRTEYSTFVAGLKKFGLWDELAAEGPNTVFAPSNEVLAEHGITEESISEMDVSDYVGARLFGAYIIYGNQYFIRDYEFYVYNQMQHWYLNPLRDDEEYNQIFMGKFYFNYNASLDMLGSQFFLQDYFDATIDYSLAISKRTTPYYYFSSLATDLVDFLGGGASESIYMPDARRHYNVGVNMYRNDNLCDNGLVHEIHSVLVLPEEALIEED